VAGGEVLLVTVEGSAPRIVRVDPRDGSEATELDLADFLQQRWGMPVSYVITAYNDMAKIRDPAGGEALLIGIVYRGKTTNLTAGREDPVAGDDQRHRIPGHGLTDIARRFWPSAEPLCQSAIARRVAPSDPSRRSVDLL
jgi:hypothetical protein